MTNPLPRKTCIRITAPLSLFLLLLAVSSPLHCVANETGEPQLLVKQVITEAGGEEKLLHLFRFSERVLITDKVAAPPTPDEKGNRTSVVQVGGDWWVGASKRNKDKVRVLCWAWSLRILLEPKSQIAAIPETTIGNAAAVGLRVTESVAQPIDLWFDAKTKRLLAIDYTDTRHVFSDWKTTDAGHRYPSHVAGYRFTDIAAKKTSEKQWYQTDLLEVTPLQELPSGFETTR